MTLRSTFIVLGAGTAAIACLASCCAGTGFRIWAASQAVICLALGGGGIGIWTAFFLREMARAAERLGDMDDTLRMPRPPAAVCAPVFQQFNRLAARIGERGEEVQQLQACIRELEQQLDEERARLEERLAQRTRDLHLRSELAVTDELTGLPNRREAMNKMKLLWDNRRMYADPLAVILLDIDHFKRINDTLGHAVGDIVLKQTADVLRSSLRATDTVCRVGGEEFLVLCASGGMEGAAACAEKLRTAMEQHVFAVEGKNVRATISLGVAERNETSAAPADLIGEADRHLYVAKSAGRNRVVVAGQGLPVVDTPGPAVKESAPPRSVSQPARPSMLIVSDDARLRRRIRMAGASADCDIADHPYLADPSALISAGSPGVVVLDVVEKSDDGGWIRRARRDARFAQSGIILLDGGERERDAAAMIAAGADLLLARTDHPSAIVAHALALARLQRRMSNAGDAASASSGESRVLTLLLDLSRSLNASFTLSAVLARAAVAATQLTRWRKAVLLVPDATEGNLLVGGSAGFNSNAPTCGPFSISSTVPGRVFREKQRLILDSAADSTGQAGGELGRPAVLLPLTAAAGAVGVLWVSGSADGRPLGERELAYLDQLCNMTSSAIADAQSRKARDKAQDSIVEALGKLAEYRDDNTGRHVERVTVYSMLLAEELRNDHALQYSIDEQFLRDLRRSVPLHDIGKVGIPDDVLLRPKELSLEQRAIMRMHVKIGVDSIRGIAQCVPGASYLRMAEEIAGAHHEWFNGGGYPRGLKGRDIPLSARIVALADVYDALTTRRPYKPAFGHAEGVAIISRSSGTQFDPDIVNAFRRCEARFAILAAQLADDPTNATLTTAATPSLTPTQAVSAEPECYDLSPM